MCDSLWETEGRGGGQIWSKNMTYFLNGPSRVWPFGVMWRHRSRDHLIPNIYWRSLGTKPPSLTVSEIFNGECDTMVGMTLIRPLMLTYALPILTWTLSVYAGLELSCLQRLIFEWKSALNFNPWAKFQHFSSFRSIPTLRLRNFCINKNKMVISREDRMLMKV